MLGAAAFDELSQGDHADEDHCRAGSEDGGGRAILCTNVEGLALQAAATRRLPLLVRCDRVVL